MNHGSQLNVRRTREAAVWPLQAMRTEITTTIKQLSNWRNENVKGISGTPESADECPR
jgi:hypothetical protein